MENYENLTGLELAEKRIELIKKRDYYRAIIDSVKKISEYQKSDDEKVNEYLDDIIKKVNSDLNELNQEDEQIGEILKVKPIFTIVNEDGTDISTYPKNPLKEKWDKLYPPIPKPEYSQVCDGYSCDCCGRCPKGSYWEVPEEDKEIWEQYREQVKEYDRIHNPKLYNMVYGRSKMLEKNN